MKFGNLELKHGLFLAPMAGFSDRAMRRICHDMGAEYSVTEMISAKAVTFMDKKTFALAGIRDDEGPVGLQIFGSEPDVMARAADILMHREYPHGYAYPQSIDINMGCPVQKIFGNGEGSALMKDPDLIYRIIRAVKGAVDVPVTVKIRAGVNDENINAPECASAAESGGADMITVHGRTRVQMYSGRVNREIIKKVKQSVQIPVIANGDIISAADAISMLKDTETDGIAIGRGAVGNPFIFREIASYMDGEEYCEPTLEEKINVSLLQLRLAIEDKGEQRAVTEARKQIAMYLRSFAGASAIRAEINKAVSYKEAEHILMDVLSEHSE